MRIKITADSTCDLPEHLVEAYDIRLTPLYVVLGEQSYADKVEITPAQVFEYMADSKNTCHTAACNVAEYRQVFSEYQHYDAIIHISLSAQFSCSYGNAVQAAQEFSNVYVVDSAHLCAGSGLLVERAAQWAAAGMAAAEIAAMLTALTPKVEASFIINSLEYLKRGGRCSALSQFGANLLQMKLCIEVRDGRMHVGKKYRGAFAKCLKKYLTERLSGRQDIVDEVIYFGSAGCPAELVAEARAVIEELGCFKRIVELEAGCVISCHCGPVTVGMFYEVK